MVAGLKSNLWGANPNVRNATHQQNEDITSKEGSLQFLFYSWFMLGYISPPVWGIARTMRGYPGQSGPVWVFWTWGAAVSVEFSLLSYEWLKILQAGLLGLLWELVYPGHMRMQFSYPKRQPLTCKAALVLCICGTHIYFIMGSAPTNLDIVSNKAFISTWRKH